MSNYEQWESGLTPAGFAGRWGRAWGTVLGQLKDATLELAKEAVRARFLPSAPDDALPRIAADRRIERAAGESLESFRGRLVGAWETWSWAGTERGLREGITLASLGSPTFYTQAQFPRPPLASGYWSRFTVLFSGRVTFDGLLTWDDGVSEWDGRYVDPVEDLAEGDARRLLRTILAKWKSARDRVTSVIIARGASLWDLSADEWDGEITWDGEGEVTEFASELWDTSDDLTWDDPDPGHVYDYFL